MVLQALLLEANPMSYIIIIIPGVLTLNLESQKAEMNKQN